MQKTCLSVSEGSLCSIQGTLHGATAWFLPRINLQCEDTDVVLGNSSLGLWPLVLSSACALGNVTLPGAVHVLLIPGPHTDFSTLFCRLPLQLPWHHTPDMTNTEHLQPCFSPGLPLSFTCSSHRYSLSTYSVPGPVSGTRETAANKTMHPPPRVYIPVGTQIVNEWLTRHRLRTRRSLDQELWLWWGSQGRLWW